MQNIKRIIPIILIILMISVSVATFAWFTVSSSATLEGTLTADSSITVSVVDKTTEGSDDKKPYFLELDGTELTSKYNGQQGGWSEGGDAVYAMRLDLEFYADAPQNLAVKLDFAEIILEVSSFFTLTEAEALKQLFNIETDTEIEKQKYIGHGSTMDSLQIDDSDGFDYVFNVLGGNQGVAFLRIPAFLAKDYFHIASYDRDDYEEIVKGHSGAPTARNFTADDEFIVPHSKLSAVYPANKIKSSHVIFFEPANWETDSEIVCPLSNTLFTNSNLRFKFVLSGRNTTEVA